MRYLFLLIWIRFFNSIQGQSPSGTSNFRNYRLELFEEGKTYDAAKSVCEGRNAWLVEIKDEETQAAIRQLQTSALWIGLHYDSGWKWNNIEHSLKYTNWFAGNPQIVNSNKNNYCGSTRTSDGKWFNTDCQLRLRYVCQLDLTWTLYSNSNLALTIMSNPKKSFSEANISCITNGKSLVSINTDGLDSLLTTKLSQLGTMNYWTSGNDLKTEDSWKWGDGTTISKTDAHWLRWPGDKNEPNGGKDENCLLKHAVYNYKWADTKCTAKTGYICQKDVTSGNCGTDVCLNRGICTVSNTRYTCKCKDGFFGTKCEKGKF
ncbi:C-type mannose receptor 2-like [Styela clava]